MASRSYCFTLNNYTEDEIKLINSLPVRYLIYGQEVGESGTPHLQGYLELTKPSRIAGMKKLPGLERAHFEKRMGTRDQARTYCMKDNQYTEIGDWSSGGQGTRNDLKSLMTAIKENRPKLDVMEEMPEVYARNMRFAEAYRAECEKQETKEFRHVKTHVYWGDAGTGKTKLVHEKDPDVFTVNPDETFPFEGYDGEKTILIDDFYGDFKYHNLLRILDGHQYKVNIKGSHRYAKWTSIYITSNQPPESWYKYGLTPALKRRLTTVTQFGNEVGGNTSPHLDLSII